MENIQECAIFYNSLIDKDYIFTLENGIKFKLYFKPSNFYHLMGLHKLNDVRLLKINSYNKIYKDILSGIISVKTIENSAFYYKIADRVEHFGKITDMLDKEKSKIIIDFNRELIGGTELINTKYILYRDIALYDEEKSGYANLTIGERQEKIYPETFFYEKSKRYISEQILLDVTDIKIKSRKSKKIPSHPMK